MSAVEPHAYGFRWGPMNVCRLTHFTRGKRESYVLGVKTDHVDVEVSVSRTGRSVRVWIDGQEITTTNPPSEGGNEGSADR